MVLISSLLAVVSRERVIVQLFSKYILQYERIIFCAIDGTALGLSRSLNFLLSERINEKVLCNYLNDSLFWA